MPLPQRLFIPPAAGALERSERPARRPSLTPLRTFRAINEESKNEKFCIVATFLDPDLPKDLVMQSCSCEGTAEGPPRSRVQSDMSHKANGSNPEVSVRVPSNTSNKGTPHSAASPRRALTAPLPMLPPASPRCRASKPLPPHRRPRPHHEARYNRAAAAEALFNLDPQLRMKILAVAERGRKKVSSIASAEHARRIMTVLFRHSYDGVPQVKRQVFARNDMPLAGGGSAQRYRAGTKQRPDLEDDMHTVPSAHPVESADMDPSSSSVAGSRLSRAEVEGE